MAGKAPNWDRPRILLQLFASVIGQVLLIVPGERLVGAALLGLNAVYFVLFFRNVRNAAKLEKLLLESGDLDEDFEEEEDTKLVGSTYPWIFLLFPVLYVASAFDANIDPLVAVVVWFDLARLVVQFLMVAVVHADLRHKVKMLTDPEYLQKVLENARLQKEKQGK